jgi:hypothetical protein
MRTLQQDLDFGKRKELELLDLVKKIDGELEISTRKNSSYDYISKNSLVELKSRTNNYKKYASTMIGENKIQYFNNDKRECYCVFSFTDGVYYCKITPELLEKCQVKRGGRCDRGCYETSLYRFIPIELLTPLSKGVKGD